MVYIIGMTKDDAKYIFRGTANLASALGITKQAISQWPDDLPQKTSDLIVGAAIRLGINPNDRKPEAFK